MAVQLERLRRKNESSFKELINEALRRGLRDMSKPPKKRKPFRTEPYNAGSCLLTNVDNVAEVIALLEGELHK